MVFSTAAVLAQEITGFKYTLVGENIEITYNLTGKSTDRYEVNLYRSTDGFKEPLLLVEGDIGLDQVPGRGKKIIWQAKEELGEFKGNLSLRLKAVFLPFVKFDLSMGDKFRRGKTYELSWSFGSDPTAIKLELYKGNRKISELAPKLENTGFSWEIPKEFTLGDGYSLRAIGAEREAQSPSFSIKRKVPMAAWIIPGVAVLGGVTYIIIRGMGDNREEIPDPILPN